MGIPKFYRWLSERYPLVNQPIASTQVPIIDNLYLDMNGIIHNCTHGNNPDVKLTEEEMVLQIFTYIERLFQIIQPQKLLFAAIDGCAPRAKMNQQRGRRFKAAKEAAEEAAKRLREDPEATPLGESFDSNCITPGTPFMGRLAGHLCFFFRKKMAEDPTWQKPLIIFSGHDVPGEGEHKIMEHIRWQKRQPDYPPNQRHCLYGLDADLIMLSLVSHEPHFCLLREVVSFSGGGRGQPSRETLANPKKENFILFQIGLLREYMELEFTSEQLGFPFDIEKFIDDFVLFCMLIGNDFLPTLPTLDVNEGALDTIFSVYKQLLPEMGGYLVEAGRLQHRRLELLTRHLATLEQETLEQRAKDAQWFADKQKSRGGGGGRARVSQLDPEDEELFGGALEGEDDPTPAKAAEPTMMSVEARRLIQGQGQAGLQMWKARYYKEKLGVDPSKPGEVRRAVEAYIAGLHWVLEYYYRGVISWGWFYPYHYSPMMSDLVGLESIRPDFERGEPFTPYQQLLAVLPAASYRLLPKPYQALMTDQRSPIADFYPLNFSLDSEGKRQDWEAVVVLEFVDVPRLRHAETLIPANSLSSEEVQRNQFGPLLHFAHSADSTDKVFCASTLPARIPDVQLSRSVCTPHQPLPVIPPDQPGFLPQLVPGTITGKGAPPGFPTLRNLEVSAKLKMAGIVALGQPSKRESLILTVEGRQAEAAMATAPQLAAGLLGQRLWIKWPFMQEAVVSAVSDPTCKVGGDRVSRAHSREGAEEWRQDLTTASSTLRQKSGVEIGPCNVLLHVLPCEGLVRHLDNSVEKHFAKKAIVQPLQVVLKHNESPDPRLDPHNPLHESQQRLAAGAVAIFVGKAHFGCLATVLPPLNSNGERREGGADESGVGLLRVSVDPAPASAFTAIQTAKRLLSNFQVTYMPSHQVSRSLGVSPRCLSMLTGSAFFRADDKKVDVGLCVKHVQQSLCVPDYARPQPDNQGWLYSQALLQVIQKYKASFSWVFHAIDGCGESRGDIDCSSALPGRSPAEQLTELKKVQAWLKSLPLSRRLLVKTTSNVASEQAIRTLQSTLPPVRQQAPLEVENVQPNLLLAPNDAGSIPSVLSGQGSTLGDRVAFLGRGGPAPLAARGTVIGVHGEDFEVLFDAPFTGGNDLQGRCKGNCGAICSSEDLLNLTNPRPVGIPTPRNGVATTRQAGQRNPSPTPVSGSTSGRPPPGFGSSPSKGGKAAAPPAANGRSPTVADKGEGSSAWVTQRRRSMEVSKTPPPGGLPGEASASEPGKAVQGKRKVVDPLQGSKGFAMGRGRGLSAPSNRVPPSSSAAIGSAPGSQAPGGEAKPQGLSLLQLLQGASPTRPPSRPSNEPGDEHVNANHKVHRGLGAAKEILRLSQTNLAAMDTASDADAHPSEQPATHQSAAGASRPPQTPAEPSHSMMPGSTFLSLLQGKSPLSTAQGPAPPPRPTPSAVPTPPGGQSLPSWFQPAVIGSASSSKAPQLDPPAHSSAAPPTQPADLADDFFDAAPAEVSNAAVASRFQGVGAAPHQEPGISAGGNISEEMVFWSSLGAPPETTATSRPPPPAALQSSSAPPRPQARASTEVATAGGGQPLLTGSGSQEAGQASKELAFWTSLGGGAATARQPPPPPEGQQSPASSSGAALLALLQSGPRPHPAGTPTPPSQPPARPPPPPAASHGPRPPTRPPGRQTNSARPPAHTAQSPAGPPPPAGRHGPPTPPRRLGPPHQSLEERMAALQSTQTDAGSMLSGMAGGEGSQQPTPQQLLQRWSQHATPAPPQPAQNPTPPAGAPGTAAPSARPPSNGGQALLAMLQNAGRGQPLNAASASPVPPGIRATPVQAGSRQPQKRGASPNPGSAQMTPPVQTSAALGGGDGGGDFDQLWARLQQHHLAEGKEPRPPGI